MCLIYIYIYFILLQRLSELCCFAVSHLVTIGKSIISNSKDSYSAEDALEISVKIDWPEDSILKAKMIRLKVESMNEDVEAISNGFITGLISTLTCVILCTFNSPTIKF